MSGATMARANFKKYKEISNPLASDEGKQDSKSSNASTDTDTRHDREATERQDPRWTLTKDEKEEEDDPFGLNALMKERGGREGSGNKSDQRDDGEEGAEEEEEEEEEEDPFGLGAIMGTTPATPQENGGGGDTAGVKRVVVPPTDAASGGNAPRKKSQKTTGGYFSGTSARRAGTESNITSTSFNATATTSQRSFFPADSFEGARRGYVFQKGGMGLGYYVDKSGNSDAGSRRALPTAAQVRHIDGAAAVAAPLRAQDGGKKRPPVDVSAAAQKLGALLVKPKKAAKAASLMADLMQAELRQDNARLFFRCLKPLAMEPAGDAALAAGKGGARAFRLLLERGAEGLGGAAEGVRAVTWELLFGLRHDVKTDDSFQFARALKRLRQAVEALGDVTSGGAAAGITDNDSSGTKEKEGGDMSLSLERKRAVVLIMKEAFKSYHLAWARPCIEPAFKAAADRRRLFPEGELRDALDVFTDTITKRQRNPGGAMAPPSRSIRSHNSMAHPMLNKRSDVIK